MPNIRDHAGLAGGLTLEERPFDELDSLILSQIVYMPMEGFLSGGGRATLGDLWAFLQRESPDGIREPFQAKRYALTGVCAAQPRYRDWELHGCVNEIDVERETQFAACRVDMPGGQTAVCFRGTDWSLAGWKEDLNMSFMTVPAQRKAVSYVERAAAGNGQALYLLGHSKGGNLAVYAGANVAGETQSRIRRVYTFDGPGMDEETPQSPGYALVGERIESYVPQSSVVGMLLRYHPVYTVVRSKALGLLQHDAMTWQVDGGAFAVAKDIDISGKLANETIHAWLEGMDGKARKLLADTLHQVVAATRIETVSGMVRDWQGSTLRMLEALRDLPVETRKSARRMLRALFGTGAAEAIRMILPLSMTRKAETEKAKEEG